MNHFMREDKPISRTVTAALEAKRAEQPFQFMAASYLIRIGAEPVQTLGELRQKFAQLSSGVHLLPYVPESGSPSLHVFFQRFCAMGADCLQ